MVMVRYNSVGMFLIAGYKLVAGLNEIKDDDFYKFMEIKTFRYRVESKIIEVPKGFLLEKVEVQVKPTKEIKPEKRSEKDLEKEAEEMENEKVQGILKNIQKSQSVEFLKAMSTDKRSEIKDAAKKRLEVIQKPKGEE